jgi:predicted PurR-regulated permease PerM
VLLIVLLATLAAGAFALRDNAAQSAEAPPEAAERLRQLLTTEQSAGDAGNVQKAADVLQRETPGAIGPTRGGSAAAPAAGSNAGSFLQRGAQAIFSFAGHAMLVIFLVFCLLTSGNHFRSRFIDRGSRRQPAPDRTAPRPLAPPSGLYVELHTHAFAIDELTDGRRPVASRYATCETAYG